MIDTGDTAWMLVATALVLMMTPALGLFYAGLVRSKNTLNTFMMSVAAIAITGSSAARRGAQSANTTRLESARLRPNHRMRRLSLMLFLTTKTVFTFNRAFDTRKARRLSIFCEYPFNLNVSRSRR